jgi:hypothetical protein
MHYLLNQMHTLGVWWSGADNTARLTLLLVLVTLWYTILTSRMARAIAQQTRAMVQPVVVTGFHWDEEKYYPVGFFEIKNRGTQPVLLLDVKLRCHHDGGKRNFTEHYTLWDEHIIPPGEELNPKFDFRHHLKKLGWISPLDFSYSLEIVASDLSKKVVLKYTNILILTIVTVREGLPLAVRWRYFVKRLTERYFSLQYRLKRRGRDSAHDGE